MLKLTIVFLIDYHEPLNFNEYNTLSLSTTVKACLVATLK
jgi:hypothetical protein